MYSKQQLDINTGLPRNGNGYSETINGLNGYDVSASDASGQELENDTLIQGLKPNTNSKPKKNQVSPPLDSKSDMHL